MTHRSTTRRIFAHTAACLLLLCPGAAGADIADFTVREAESLAGGARTREELLQAAATYAEAARARPHSGDLPYNAGTLYLQAGDFAAAAAWLERASIYDGGRHDVRRNLLLACRGLANDEAVGLPWYRTLFFWHFDIPLRLRLAALGIAYAVLCLVSAMRTARLARIGSGTPVLAFVLTLVLATSVAASLHAQWTFEPPTPSPALPSVRPGGAP